MVTRNIFTWLHEVGFAVAERAICEQELVDQLDSDDESVAGANLHG
jgi:hypothetical protein